MPLDPKQQPPYYRPGTTTGTPFQTIHTQTTIQESSGTSQTTTAAYEIPANTLTQDGDIIILNQWGNAYNNPTIISMVQTIFDQAIALPPFVGDGAYNIKTEIMRKTSSIIAYSITMIKNSIDPISIQGTIGSLNFATPYNVNLLIQANTDGNVRLSAAYITLLKTQ